MYKIITLPEVLDDLEYLSQEVLDEVFDYFKKYETEPFKYSGRLYNQGNIKLDGYRKTYVAQATYRIVFKIEDGIAKIVEIIAVGKREDKEVYQDASLRI
ncbi:MAG: hypothetical protein U9Q66_02325 [Patescibacteria group bacterium]|nr:hypothetical protein [Patescibacteria group bacterium]